MRALVGVAVAVVLTGSVARAEVLPLQEHMAEEVVPFELSEAGKMQAIANYYQRIGKTTTANFYRAKAERIESSTPTKRVFIRVKQSPGSPPHEAQQMGEVLRKSIANETPHRIVKSVEEADMILDVEMTPVTRRKP